MPLSPDFTVAISTDRETVTLTDSTTYGTGGNPARADLRVFVNTYKVDYENTSTAITTTGDDSDPQTDSVWSAAYGVDGHYKWLYVAIPEYNAGTTYAQYAAVFDPADDAVYRSVQGSNTGQSLANTAYWAPISDPATLANNKGEANESANITSTIYNRVLSANGQYTYANLVSEQCTCTDCDEEATLKKISDLDNLLTGMAIADNRQEVTDGELIARKIQSRFIDCV